MLIRSRSPEETVEIGKVIGRLLKEGTVVCLRGELGSGKTKLAEGIARGLSYDGVRSPTFTIANEYSGGKIPLKHLDLYRLESPRELEDIGFEEYLDSEGVTLIEWPELAESLLPEGRLEIRLQKDGETGRLLEVTDLSGAYGGLMEELKSFADPGN